jgi:5'-nucleotidase/UDP-sugar diphosphatase
MTIAFDPQRAAGSRVLAIAVGSAPLDPNKFYRVAVNDFMARGGDGYVTFAAVDPLLPLEDTPLLSDEVMIYLRDLGHSVQSRVEGRITAK